MNFEIFLKIFISKNAKIWQQNENINIKTIIIPIECTNLPVFVKLTTKCIILLNLNYINTLVT